MSIMSNLQSSSAELLTKVDDSNNSKKVNTDLFEKHLHSREEHRLQTSNVSITSQKKFSNKNVNLMKREREQTMEFTSKDKHRSKCRTVSRQVKEEKEEFANNKHDYTDVNVNYNLNNSTSLTSTQLNKNSALRIQITSALTDQHRRYLNTLEESWKTFLKANELNSASCLLQEDAIGVTKLESAHRSKEKRVKRKEVATESANITPMQKNGSSDCVKVESNVDSEHTNNYIESTLSDKTKQWKRSTYSRDAICNVLSESEIEHKWIIQWRELMLDNSSFLRSNLLVREKKSSNDTCTNIANSNFDELVTPEIKEVIHEHYVRCPSYSTMSASAARTCEGFVWSPQGADNSSTQNEKKESIYKLFLHDADYSRKPSQCIHLHLCSVCQLPALYRCTRCRTALFCSDKCYNIHQSTRCQKYIV